jgi:hypothetical protein
MRNSVGVWGMLSSIFLDFHSLSLRLLGYWTYMLKNALKILTNFQYLITSPNARDLLLVQLK